MRTEQEIRQLLERTKEALQRTPVTTNGIMVQNPEHAAYSGIIQALQYILEIEPTGTMTGRVK